MLVVDCSKQAQIAHQWVITCKIELTQERRNLLKCAFFLLNDLEQ